MTGCPDGEFKCDNYACTSNKNLCDGVDNCGDGSDEAPALCNGEWYRGFPHFMISQFVIPANL